MLSGALFSDATNTLKKVLSPEKYYKGLF